MTDQNTQRRTRRFPDRISGLLARLSPRKQSGRKSGTLTVLLWTSDGFHAIRGASSRAADAAHSPLSSPWPEDQTADDTEARGAWLRQQLETADMAAAPVLLVFPRSDSFQKLLTLPAGDAADAPQFVQYLVQSLPAANGGDCVYDFTPLVHTAEPVASASGDTIRPATTGPAASRVLLSVINRGMFCRACNTIAAAGLQLAGATLSTDLIAAAIADHEEQSTDAGDRLIVSDCGDGSELIVQRGRRIVCAQHLESTSSPLTLPLLKRFLIASQSSRGTVPITEAIIISNPDTLPTIAAVIAEALPGATVRNVDFSAAATSPTEEERRIGTNPPSADASLRAMAAGGDRAFSRNGRNVVDFSDPQQPPPTRPRRTGAMIAAATLLATIVGGLYLQRESRLDELGTEYQALMTEQTQLKQRIQDGQTDRETDQRLAGWLIGKPAWLEDLLHLSDHMPAAERAYVVRLELNTATAERDNSGGQMRVAGYARDLRDVISINQKLAGHSERYDPLPHAIRRSSLDQRYPYRFDLDVKLRSIAPETSPESSQEIAGNSTSTAGNFPAAKNLAGKSPDARQHAGGASR